MHEDASKNWMAFTSLGLGVVGLLVCCCIPVCALPFPIAGVVLGALGVKSEKRTIAIVGIALNVVGLLLIVANMATGAFMGEYMQRTGRHPLQDLVQPQGQAPTPTPTPTPVPDPLPTPTPVAPPPPPPQPPG